MTTAQLRERWSASEIARVNSSLATGEIPRDFPTIDDPKGIARIDLRGIPITEMLRVVHLQKIDFSFCMFQDAGQFIGVKCADCVFIGAVLDTNLGMNFVRCDFTNATFNVLRGRFEECRFNSAKLNASLGSKVQFIKCDFLLANFRKANLYECLFDQCLWGGNKFRSGSLADSKFRGSRPSDSELGNTMMDGTTFIDIQDSITQ